MRALIVTSLLAGVVPTVAAAQAGHDHHTHGASHAVVVSAAALAQIETVRASVADLATTEAARAAGFRPALGLIPTMGTHWVNRQRMRDDAKFDLSRPDHLMFAPVNGKDVLVGVAFAYRDAPDATPPDGFDGDADQWHDHPELAPPGQTLTMLHVWFVPSPDGPFAGHNPWLPYFAVGLEPPDATALADKASSYRVRALALALAETVQPLGGGQLLRRLPAVAALRAETDPWRDEIRAAIPRLEAAARTGDAATWNAAADDAVKAWEQIRAATLDAIPIPGARERLADFYQQMLTGKHSTH